MTSLKRKKPRRSKKNAPVDETFSEVLADGQSVFSALVEPAASVPIIPIDNVTPHYAPKANATEYHHGHRNRLRERFIADNGKSMPEYELLEMLLSLARPRIDTKPLAKTLLNNFGSIGNIMLASDHRLDQIPGIGLATICALRLVHEISQRSYRKSLQSKNILSQWNEMVDYCQKHLAGDDVECLHALFLDSSYHLIKDQILQTGTMSQISVFPREVFKAALHVGATYFILVHNHPSGDPNPSDADIKTTNHLKTISSHLGLTLLDHLIIGSNRRYTSLKNSGWL